MIMISFKELKVDSKSTKIVLVYDPEKNFKIKLDDNKVKSIIKQKIKDNISMYNDGWSKMKIHHEFQLQIDRINEINYWDFRTVL